MNKNPNHPDRPHPITQRQGDSNTLAVNSQKTGLLGLVFGSV